MLIRIIIAAVLIVVFSLLPAEGYLRFVLFMIPYLVIGYDILKKAFKGILNKQVFDENFLMAVATVGAILLGDYSEGVAVMLFYQIGELFQSYAVGKSRRNISELMDIRPDYANIEKDGTLEQVDPDEVEIGTIIVVQPGEKVPIDGVITEGTSTLNTSALTGESLPRDAKAGDEVISGCINMTGLLKIRTTKEFGESTVSKILELVENSSSRKSKSENFISKFAKYYTPAVCYGALALAFIPPIVLLIMGKPAMWGDWIYRALTFLVISCPCALVISIPLSFFAGIGGASNQGILVKGSNYLETLAQTKYVVFDKTGTMTQGVFEVSGIHHNEMPDEKLLEYAALAECSSSHPISKSLQKAYGKPIDRNRVTDIEEISGNGVIAKVDGISVAAGNTKLMNRLGIAYQDCHHVGTVVHMAIDGKYAGHILISDIIKPHAKEAIAELKKAGITVKFDDRDTQKPGWKFADYELKGVPVRLAMGERDLENGTIEVARRDTLTKETLPLEGIVGHIEKLLEDIQENIYKKALDYRNSRITTVDSYDEFKEKIEEGGFILAHWDGTTETEEKIKEETKATIRCIPFDSFVPGDKEPGKCMVTGKPSACRVIFARSY